MEGCHLDSCFRCASSCMKACRRSCSAAKLSWRCATSCWHATCGRGAGGGAVGSWPAAAKKVPAASCAHCLLAAHAAAQAQIDAAAPKTAASPPPISSNVANAPSCSSVTLPPWGAPHPSGPRAHLVLLVARVAQLHAERRHGARTKARTAALELVHYLVHLVVVHHGLLQPGRHLLNLGGRVLEVQLHHLGNKVRVALVLRGAPRRRRQWVAQPARGLRPCAPGPRCQVAAAAPCSPPTAAR